MKVVIKPSTNKEKKYMAIFYDGDKKVKITHFGQKKADDYTITKNKEQRDRYRTRHKKDLDTKDPTRAGYLSWYILWNKPTLEASINNYKKKFNLT
tara:strand:- start:2854 stop:3141 length:288 start_codon:yes stop_codon:yes gene_type:complete